MYTFLQSQLDYIFFLYGLAFVLLGVVSFLIKRQYNFNVFWYWLSAFGFLHGLNEWCDMIGLTVGTDIYWFKILRLFLLTTSFVCLLEFARQSWNQFNKYKIQLWIYVFIGLAISLGWYTDGANGLEIFARCILGFGGAIGGGLALLQFSNATNDHKHKICFGAVAFWLYATTQLFFSSGQLFGIKYTNQAIFFETFGFPIQLVRAFLAIIIFVCIWLHYQKALQGELKRQQLDNTTTRNYKFAYSLLGVFVVGWLLSVSLGHYAWRQERREGQNIIEASTSNLEKILTEGKDLARVLSGSPGVIRLLADPTPQNVEAANLVLDRYQTSANVSISYVLDKNGNTLATSNRFAPDSLQGKNYAFRPYFTKAINDSPAILFAIGVTTKKAGFYASYPVKNEQGNIMGVAVIKMDLAAVEKNFQYYGTVFLVSPEGVIFLSGKPEYDLKSVKSLSYLQKRQLYQSQEFDKGTFEEIFDVWPKDNELVLLHGDSYLVGSKQINDSGWSVIYLHSGRLIGFFRLFGIVITFVFYILIISFVTMAQDVRRSTALSQLASVVFSSDDAIVGKDLKGNIISWNKGAEKIYGYSKQEVIGKSCNVLMATSEEKKKNDMLLKKVSLGQSFEHQEAVHLKKNGEVIFVSLTVSPVRDSLGVIVGVSMVSRDMTKEKIAEEIVKHSEKKFSTLFDNINDMVFISDLEGNFLNFNKTAMEILGYTKKEMLAMTCKDILIEKSTSLVTERLNLVKKEKIKMFEETFVTKTGVIIPVDVRSSLIDYDGREAVLKSARDITERKLTEATLKQQMTELEKFKLAVDGTTDSIVITDSNANILYANDAVTNMTGFNKKDIIGKYIGNLWGGHMEKGFYEKMWDTIKNKKQIFVGELNNRRKTGEEYIVLVKFYPLLDKAGHVEFFVGVETDITMAKQTARTKAEFVSVASHQLRTPLTGIKWFSELLLKGRAGKLVGDQKDYIQQILDSNDRMIKLVDDLLDVSHMDENGRFKLIIQPEEFSEIIKEVVSEQQLIANSKKIKIKIGSDCLKKIKLKMDKSKIEQALQNILNNAIKYSPVGSTVNFDCKKDKDNFVCSIADAGIGIPTYQHYRVFEKFFRADNVISTGSGTGLGLYISKYIITGHGGKIWFESEENKGTIFYISLPIK